MKGVSCSIVLCGLTWRAASLSLSSNNYLDSLSGGGVESLSLSSDNYLASLSGGGVGGSSTTTTTEAIEPPPSPPEQQQLATSIEPALPPPTTEITSDEDGLISPIFSHAPLSYFAIDKLTPKGPRKNADVGYPHDSTRPLCTVGSTSVGSWWCAEGGWPSPDKRQTTEVFYVFDGHGCVTDVDGMKHEFQSGDLVILPKGWSGRWDVIQAIHKVWVVHDHADIAGTSDIIRAITTPSTSFSAQNLIPQGMRPGATHGSPMTSLLMLYDKGPIKVGCSMCTPGSFPFQSPTTECFHVLGGVCFLTNADGTARRCVAGDTVALPKGWAGYWDIIDTIKTAWVVVE